MSSSTVEVAVPGGDSACRAVSGGSRRQRSVTSARRNINDLDERSM